MRTQSPVSSHRGRRTVVLMPQLASVLTRRRLASLHSQEADYVFPAPDGRGRDHRSTARGIERAVKRAGLGKGVSAHSFRHTFASQLSVGLGLDPVRVSRLLGHTSQAFTASTYVHMFEHTSRRRAPRAHGGWLRAAPRGPCESASGRSPSLESVVRSVGRFVLAWSGIILRFGADFCLEVAGSRPARPTRKGLQ